MSAQNLQTLNRPSFLVPEQCVGLRYCSYSVRLSEKSFESITLEKYLDAGGMIELTLLDPRQNESRTISVMEKDVPYFARTLLEALANKY